MANSTGDAFSHTKQVVLPRATLCAAFLFSSLMQKKKEKRRKKVGCTCQSNGGAALPYPSAGLEVDEEECWENEKRKIIIPERPQWRSWNRTRNEWLGQTSPDGAAQAGEPTESRRTIRSSFAEQIF